MFYTNRLMLRGLDVEADMNTVLQWMNDVDFLRALSSDAQRPTSREAAKSFIQARATNENGLPCFAICERPRTGTVDQLDASHDLFVQDHKPLHHMIGMLNIRRSGFSSTNRVTGLGIAFDKDHQGTQ